MLFAYLEKLAIIRLMLKLIAVTNQKGGVGKTTTAVNLASLLSRLGKKTLLIDLDPQGNASTSFGLDKTLPGTYQALINPKVARELVQTRGSLDILASNSDLAGFEVELVNYPNREYYLKSLVETLDYQLVIVDCPPSLGLLTINAFSAATDILIPVQAEFFALEGLSQLLDTVSQVKKGLNHSLSLLGVVLTMYDSRLSLSQQVKHELEVNLKGKMFKTIIPRNVRLAEAPSFAKPIVEYDRFSKGARLYKKLAKEVRERLYG